MLKNDISLMWDTKKVTVILIIVGALGAITTGFKKSVEAIRINMKVDHAQKFPSQGQ